ncbi:MAG: peptidylprolyl isomerase [Spirochaetales bacterium]|nr:peptidylprolyl isomerase [Spirochaetales bacterium]
MKIENNKFVSIHYTLKDDEGNLIDSSRESEPLSYVHGRGYLIPGLEAQLEGKTAGDKFSTIIAPKDGYGEYNPQLVVEVTRDQFDTDMQLEIGMQFQAMTQSGPAIVHITEIKDDKIKIDANHELAGKNLHFDVEVMNVRDATEEELNPPSCCGGGCGGNCGGGCGGDCESSCGECGDCNNNCSES